MQGSHEDALYLHAPDSPSRQEAKAELNHRIKNELSIPSFKLVPTSAEGSSLDKALRWVRTFSSRNVAMIIALCCGWTDIDKFRQHKLARVAEGRKFIVWIQSVRTNYPKLAPLLDRYFAFASYWAEEEFYLITLPFIFWNLDWLFAHHLLFVVSLCMPLYAPVHQGRGS
jgi:hypothetical protein